MTKRQAILSAAQHELADRGSHAMTMAAVARRAGVATGTLYLYFSDKRALLAALQEQVMRTTAEAVCGGDDPSRPIAERIPCYWLRLYRFFVVHPELLRCWLYYVHAPECDRSEVMARQNDLFAPLVSLLDEARLAGLVKPWPAELLALIALDSAVALAEKQHLGFMPTLTDATLQQLATAGWQAIAMNTVTA